MENARQQAQAEREAANGSEHVRLMVEVGGYGELPKNV